MTTRADLETRLESEKHLLRYWDELSAEQQKSLCEQVESFSVKEVKKCLKESEMIHISNSENLKPIPRQRHATLEKMSKEEKERYFNLGLEAISRNEVCALVLAGGQASRLGSSAPKGTISLGCHVAEGDSLLASQAAKLARLEELASTTFPGSSGRIQWAVMTSASTEVPTMKHLEYVVPSNGLKMDQLIVFSQANIPAFDKEGKLLLSDKGVISTSPNGNGGLYSALAPHLETLTARGVKYFHVYCVDNVLCRVADPTFIGYCIEKNADCAAKTVLKHPGELIGAVAMDGEVPRVVEYSELGPVRGSLIGSDGRLEFCAGNIANHFFTMEFLKSFCTPSFHLPYHRAHKKISYINEDGVLMKPIEPNGIKLEQFVFDVFPMSKNFYIFEVPREDEFSPLKNAESVGKDCLSTCKKDLSAQSSRWLKSVGAIVPSDMEVYVAAKKSYAGEGLTHLSGKQINEVVVH